MKKKDAIVGYKYRLVLTIAPVESSTQLHKQPTARVPSNKHNSNIVMCNC